MSQNTKELVTNRGLLRLYNEVQPGGLEADTARLWMAILTTQFPASKQIYCAPEQSPADRDRKRVDVVVHCYERRTNEKKKLIYGEFKKVQRSDIPNSRHLEQVNDYCKAMLAETQAQSIEALLCAGRGVLTWTVTASYPRYKDCANGDIAEIKRMFSRFVRQYKRR
ncbi:hypothetical protein DTO021D3_7874 [Paecilomyces variotii]|nr:hypothetical protein DTO032I3_6254 [Paecilomyces variotii]KAJ9275228.1 hypothetical protein DTO021D3_7874 [Paecilomyces variotii]KAJ9341552.1 hypothetical protein DTO027B6_5916 [Paecilomyces variotii]KAJ9375942.1 hypothetical protein DTO063F5_9084 [Paecilomyces variotii]